MMEAISNGRYEAILNLLNESKDSISESSLSANDNAFGHHVTPGDTFLHHAARKGQLDSSKLWKRPL